MIKIDISGDGGEGLANDITLTEAQAVVVLAAILQAIVGTPAEVVEEPDEMEDEPVKKRRGGRPKKSGPKTTRSRMGDAQETQNSREIVQEIEEADAARRRQESEAKRNRIQLMLKEHFSVATIAAEVGVSEPTVYTLRKKMIEDGRLSLSDE